MSTDNRDWYRDWWRKKTGYVERALFRLPESHIEQRKRNRQWRRLAFVLFWFVLFLVILKHGMRLLR